MTTASQIGSVIPSRKAVQGTGRAEIHVFGANVHFSELSYTYPLKLLSPRQTTAARDEAAQRVAILYNLTYGGGLIGGDRVELSLNIKPDAKLVLLTQGSTKVFPSRPTPRLSSGTVQSTEGIQRHTIQRLAATVASSAFLVMLPDPVTPFRGASYSQTQVFRLAAPSSTKTGGSLLLLDWFTSGRMSRGEEWQFDRYRSVNEVWIGDRQVACDALLLDQIEEKITTTASSIGDGIDSNFQQQQRKDSQARKLYRSLAPYACYATVLMYGPCTQAVSDHLQSQYNQITQMQRRTPPEPVIWSCSPLEGGLSSPAGVFDGCIVRVAGTETDAVRRWLREALRGLESQIGKDAYSKAFV
ncbi:hypothetical protein FRB91_003909 [Serendipita sp. 411]|nr:hypothetical protein FRB91_003909 [Serendipita sp. 411]